MRAAKATRTVCHTHAHAERERERENYTHTHTHTQTGNRWPQGVVERERESWRQTEYICQAEKGHKSQGCSTCFKWPIEELLQSSSSRALSMHSHYHSPLFTLRSLFLVLRLGSKFQETIFRNDLTFAFMWKLLQRDVMRTPKGYAMPARLRSNQEGVSTASGIHAGW